MPQKKFDDATIDYIQTRPTRWSRDDDKWFKRHPHRSYRVRPRLPDEWSSRLNDATDLDWVAVWQVEAGVRVRALFAIPASGCAEHGLEAGAEEHGAAVMFDLAIQGGGPVCCDIVKAILDRQGSPGGGAH